MQGAPNREITHASVTPTMTPLLESQIQKVLDEIYTKYKDVDDGTVATYIPELGKANPKHFGICLATVEGKVFTAGDWDVEFTIQSMSKPFAFQMALERHGPEKTLQHVGGAASIPSLRDWAGPPDGNSDSTTPYSLLKPKRAIAIVPLAICCSTQESSTKRFSNRWNSILRSALFWSTAAISR